MIRDESRSIWKFPLPVEDEVTLSMPAGARILCVQVQGGIVCLWAEVDKDAPKQLRRFYILGTGHSVPLETGRYIGTVQLHGGSLVFHVFERERT